MKLYAPLLAVVLLMLTPPTAMGATSPAGPPASATAPSAAPEPTLEELITKLAGLESGTYGKTLQQIVRAIKSPEQQRAVCIYIRALAYGDVAAFMSLVPEKGVLFEKEETHKKEKLLRAEAAKRAAAINDFKRPSFIGLLGDVSSEDPKSLQWDVYVEKGRLRISANGAFAWATFSKDADGRFFIEKITISFNND